jgi:hypothetical protein
MIQNAQDRYVIEAVGRAFGWRLWLDPKKGFLPTRIDQFLRTHDRLMYRIELTEFTPIDPKIAVPVKATITLFDSSPQSKTFGQATEVLEFIVDLDKSRWNSEINPSNFIAKFPEGTVVIDTRDSGRAGRGAPK